MKNVTQAQAARLVAEAQCELIAKQVEIGRRNQPLFELHLQFEDGELYRLALARGGTKKVYCAGALHLAQELGIGTVLFEMEE